MNRFFRSRAAQIGLGAFALLNFGQAIVSAQGAYRAYYVNDPVARNVVSVLSEAPLETMLTRTGLIEADVHVNPNNALDAPRARFVVDIKNFDTGIAARNQHMRSAQWMDAEKYPTATFTLTRVIVPENARLAPMPLTPGATGQMPVEGTLEWRGVTKTVRADVTCKVIAANDDTKARLPGDLLHIRAKFPLVLSDFNFQIPQSAKLKVADTQEVTVDVFAATGSDAPKWVQ